MRQINTMCQYLHADTQSNMILLVAFLNWVILLGVIAVAFASHSSQKETNE